MKLILLLVLLAGCATIDTLTPGEGTTFEVRGQSYSKIWAAAVRTLERRDLVIVTANREAGELRAEQKAGMFTWGEVVGVFIKPAGGDRYSVEVQSMKRHRLQVSDRTGRNR